MRFVGALAAVAGAFCFARLAESRFGGRARPGILWFAAATVTDLAIGRLTYALGTAFALAALYALQRGRRTAAAVLAALTAAATPLAGLFLCLAAAAVFLAGRRRAAFVLAVPAFAVAAAMALLFPEGGRQPFGIPALLVSLALTIAFLALTPEPVLRIGAGLYLAATLVAFGLASPIGGNTTRLGAVLAGPLLLCVRSQRPGGRRLAGAVGAPAVGLVIFGLFAWQWYAPVREVTRSIDDPLSRPATYSGLLAFLAAHHAAAGRVEVPFTRSHWEAAIVADRFPLARGWEKQLDAGYNPLFFRQPLPSMTYHAWLRTFGVRYVAVAMAPSDPSSRSEVGLVLGGLPYLRPVYRDPHWRVFAVVDPQPLAGAPARLTALGAQSFTLRFRRPGTAVARVHFSPYWQASYGCVARAPDGFTEVSSPRAGSVRVAIAFSLERLVGRGRRCRASAASGFSTARNG